MSIISEIQQDLKREMIEVNKLITACIISIDAELVRLISQHLIGSGGKRIRPMLMILSSKMFGYKSHCIIKLAASIELMHNATLLHDDVIDQSPTRRFKPTANTLWGDNASILVGDFLFSQSFQLMISSNSVKALRVLSQVLGIIAEGEVSQLVKFEQRNIIDLNEYEEIIVAKTGTLFSAACEVGSLIEKQPSNVCSAMKDLGINLGRMFQVSDDMLDYYGKDSETGKTIGSDFFEGKITLPLILLYNKLAPTDQHVLAQVMHANSRSHSDFSLVLKMLEKNDIKGQVIEHLNVIKAESINLLAQVEKNNKYHDYFLKLIDFFATWGI